MIREMTGTRTLASVFMPKKRRRKRNMMVPSMSTLGIMAGAGIAYMAMRKNKDSNEESEE
ncbi:hypothetical protein HMPREF1982_00891 [Clostridiales bacterium oral taxon 876 str. F0540]|nr:hypothetical protein HMPREF1982_00891 [Clostridiales bacterium oral taxon 876 str. F0540]